jgi:hypothetical protein
MSDERLDRLIDDVAKQLTAGQPSSDFRARVIASLDRHPRRAWWTSWIAVPIGAMAVTMIALAVARPFSTSAPHRMQRATVDAPKREERVGGQGRDRGAESPARQRPGQTAKAEMPPITPKPEAPIVRLPSSSPNGFGRTGKPDTTYERSQQGTRVEAADRRRDPMSGAVLIEALAPPPLAAPSIGVQALDVDRLRTESIAITELDAITPIAVEPLPPDGDRPERGQRPSPNDRNE